MDQQYHLDENSTLVEEIENQEFLDDVIEGLSSNPKSLPCKYFYDQRGSNLFEKICDQPEYYLTRSELEIMNSHVTEMADWIGPEAMVVEFGSGSGIKTRMLLESLVEPAIYVPIDVSSKHLENLADELSADFLSLQVSPLVADFTQEIQFPDVEREHSRRVVYFPGSTIGNFTVEQASDLLESMDKIVGQGGAVLIGIDLWKDVQTLENAYNDANGVTAEFNLNLLSRIKNELNGQIDLKTFEHDAIWNKQKSRIEMRLISQVDQTICIGEHEFEFFKDERILTEYSHKYSIQDFEKLAGQAGFKIVKTWTDEKKRFAVLALESEV